MLEELCYFICSFTSSTVSSQNDAALDRALMTLDVRVLSCTVPYHYRILAEVSPEQIRRWKRRQTDTQSIGVTAILELGLKMKKLYLLLKWLLNWVFL